jgi:pyroglutamyl-peptidase
MRVFIIGFGPFPGATSNPSADLAKALARRRRPALANIERISHVFPTTYAAVDQQLPALLGLNPDILLMFGLAGRRRHLSVETWARNSASILFPDANGYRPQRAVIAPGEPTALKGSAPFNRLLSAARATAYPTRLSRDAGRYLCNYAYWRALQRARGGRPLVQFVHIPPVRQKTRPVGRSRRSFPSLAQLIVAAEALLIALVAASHR